jgi:predicted nucleic acid-binding protein
MPTVISDASVLIDLGAIGLVGLLREFYAEIFVPPTVWREVANVGSRPGAAEAQLARNEGWLHVKAPASSTFLLHLRGLLDNGEAEAIALAMESPQSLLLIDESEGREAARRLGLDFTGTLGVLLRAKRIGRIAVVKPLLDDLIQHYGFRLSRALYEQLLKQVGEAP